MAYKILVMLAIVLGTCMLYGYISVPSFRRVDASKGPRGSQAITVVQGSENTHAKIGASWQKLKQALEHRNVADDLRTNPPATQQDFRNLANELGYEVPAEIKVIWSIFAGQPPECSIGLGWRFLSPDESARWAKEQLAWEAPNRGFPRLMLAHETNPGWPPGFIPFAESGTDRVGVFLEDGQVYFQRPLSGFHLEADCLETWLNNFSARIERDELKTDAFGNLKLKDDTLKSPGSFLQPKAAKASTLRKSRFARFSLFSLLMSVLVVAIAVHYSATLFSAKRSLAAVNNKSYPHWIQFREASNEYLLGRLRLGRWLGADSDVGANAFRRVEAINVPDPRRRKKRANEINTLIETLLQNEIATRSAVSINWQAPIDSRVEQFLLRHGKLKVLRISDAPSPSFCAKIAKLTSLEILEIPWTDSLELEQSLLGLNSLRWLELEGCPLQDLQRLREALPHTYINPRSTLPDDN